MNRTRAIILILLAGAVGIGIGLSIPGRQPVEGVEGPDEQTSWFVKYEEGGNEEYLPTRLAARARSNSSPLLMRANALAAKSIVDLQKLSPCPMLFEGIITEHGAILFSSVEPEIHCTAVILVFKDQQNRLVHYRHPITRNFDGVISLGCERTIRGYFVDRETLVAKGVVRDKIVYVESPQFPDDPKKIPIPDGEVVMALQYPDGSYSNFIPLASYEDDFFREEE